METLAMSVKERRRVEAGDLTVATSALLRLSYRQTRRAWSRYQSQGRAGFVHRRRGRPSNRGSDTGLRDRTLALYRAQYADYGPLAAECFAREEGLPVPSHLAA